jgi:hypothetical protein
MDGNISLQKWRSGELFSLEGRKSGAFQTMVAVRYWRGHMVIWWSVAPVPLFLCQTGRIWAAGASTRTVVAQDTWSICLCGYLDFWTYVGNTHNQGLAGEAEAMVWWPDGWGVCLAGAERISALLCRK